MGGALWGVSGLFGRSGSGSDNYGGNPGKHANPAGGGSGDGIDGTTLGPLVGYFGDNSNLLVIIILVAAGLLLLLVVCIIICCCFCGGGGDKKNGKVKERIVLLGRDGMLHRLTSAIPGLQRSTLGVNTTQSTV